LILSRFQQPPNFAQTTSSILITVNSHIDG
jgi:hypothetical protein